MKKDYWLTGKARWLKYPVFGMLVFPMLTTYAYAEDGSADEGEKVSVVQQSRTRKLQGVVTDASDGSPVIGANILIKGSQTGVITDLDGAFELDIPVKGTTLQVSFIGYKTQEVRITNEGLVEIKLSSDNEMLEEVVVVGAGTQKKVSVTGSISSVSGLGLKAPTSSLTTNLAGKLAGVIAVSNSGEPGKASEFYIRGVGTFGGRATPLILLDGIEISANDLNRIPAETIETFSILKDASATAIYGARGANGVMLVTTKTGQENQKAKINVTIENSFVAPQRMVEFVDAARWMEVYNDAEQARNPGVTPRWSQEAIDMTRAGTNPYLYPNTDWLGIMFKDMTMNQRANVNLSGGSNRVTYYMSLQANHDTGMLDTPKVYSFDNNINQWTYNFQNNLSYKVSDLTKVTLRLNAQIGNHKGPNYSTSDLFDQALKTAPNLFPPTYPAEEGDEHIRFANSYLSGTTLNKNPYAYMLSSFKETNFSTMNVSMNIDQNLDFVTKGLSAKLLVNLKSWSEVYYNRTITPYYYRAEAAPDSPNGYITRLLETGTDYVAQSGATRNSDQTIYIDARLDYNRSFGDHNVTGMLMYMQREYRNGVLPNRNQGISGRFTYDFSQRYLVEFNFGYNGSERMAKGNRFEFFPAVSLGWVPSSEKFWEPLQDQINFLKVRGSYGIVGSDETGEGAGASHFLFTNDITLGGSDGFWIGYNGNYHQGPGFNSYATENASWERVKKLDIGFEMELFNQLRITADYFNEDRYKILMKRASFPNMLGYSNAVPWSNVGEVNNRGIDLSVNWSKEIAKDLRVDARGNFTYTKNKYVYKDEPNYPYVWQTETGKSLSLTKGLIAEGLFQSQEEIDNWPTQSLGSTVKPGDIKYRDVNGDGMVTDEDRVVISPYGNMPRIQFGLGLNVTYKNFDFGVFFNGSLKRTIMVNNLDPFLSGMEWDGGDRSLLSFIADNYWSESNPNPNAKYPRLGLKQSDIENNRKASTFWMRNGDFIRFKTLELGYSFPHCRVYVTADNLLTFSKFDEWDPELSYNAYPLQRTINVGAQFNF